MEHLHCICNELRDLGITANYKGYKQAAWAIHLALEDEARLNNISREIYHPLAQLFYCSHTSIERNLRTVAHRAWSLRRTYLQELAGRELAVPPTASMFITILSARIRRITTRANL